MIYTFWLYIVQQYNKINIDKLKQIRLTQQGCFLLLSFSFAHLENGSRMLLHSLKNRFQKSLRAWMKNPKLFSFYKLLAYCSKIAHQSTQLHPSVNYYHVNQLLLRSLFNNSFHVHQSIGNHYESIVLPNCTFCLLASQP